MAGFTSPWAAAIAMPENAVIAVAAIRLIIVFFMDISCITVHLSRSKNHKLAAMGQRLHVLAQLIRGNQIDRISAHKINGSPEPKLCTQRLYLLPQHHLGFCVNIAGDPLQRNKIAAKT